MGFGVVLGANHFGRSRTWEVQTLSLGSFGLLSLPLLGFLCPVAWVFGPCRCHCFAIRDVAPFWEMLLFPWVFVWCCLPPHLLEWSCLPPPSPWERCRFGWCYHSIPLLCGAPFSNWVVLLFSSILFEVLLRSSPGATWWCCLPLVVLPSSSPVWVVLLSLLPSFAWSCFPPPPWDDAAVLFFFRAWHEINLGNVPGGCFFPRSLDGVELVLSLSCGWCCRSVFIEERNKNTY